MVIILNLAYMAIAVGLGVLLGLRLRESDRFLVCVGAPLVIFIGSAVASAYLVEHPIALACLMASAAACLVASWRPTRMAGLGEYVYRTNDTAGGAHPGNAVSSGQISVLGNKGAKGSRSWNPLKRWQKRQLPSRPLPNGRKIAMVVSNDGPAVRKDGRRKGKADHLKEVR